MLCLPYPAQGRKNDPENTGEKSVTIKFKNGDIRYVYDNKYGVFMVIYGDIW